MKMVKAKRMLSSFLAVMMLIGCFPVSAFAAAEEDGLCPHHESHEGCSYFAGSPASPCGHVCGDDCYLKVISCVHQHGDCGYSEAIPAEGECAHECSEESGCVTMMANCGHSHDETCGYAEPVLPVDCDFVCAECAAEEEPKVITVGEWVWVDTEGMLSDGELALPGANAENIVSFNMIVELLPAAISFDGGEAEVSWSCAEFPAEGAFEGTYTFRAALSEGYELSAGAAELEVPVILGGASMYTTYSGSCGTSVNWSLDTTTGVLTISGNGPMRNWDETDPEYLDYSEYITKIVVESGVTHVGQYAFNNLSNVTEAVLEEGVSSIAYQAFFSCSSLEKLSLPASLTSIGGMAFYYCDNISRVSYGGSLSMKNALSISTELSNAAWTCALTDGTFNGSPAVVDAGGNLMLIKKNFPDDNFRQNIIDTFDFDGLGYLTKTVVDTDGLMIVCDNAGIASLEGIEYFTNLEWLGCEHNSITGLDLSKNTKLDTLNVEYNSLSEITLPAGAPLTYLNCAFNQLTELDVSGLTALESLIVDYNKLTELDVSKNTVLKQFDCGMNALTALDVSGNTELAELACYGNRIRTLDLSANTALSDMYLHSQTAEAEGYWEDGSCLVDMGAIVGEENIAKVSVTSGGTYDSATGIATLTGLEDGAESAELAYSYNTGRSTALAVTVNVSVPEKPEVPAVYINEENFPDDAFRSYISGRFDPNGRGYMTRSELEAATYIDCTGKGIESLKGVEYFTNITMLDCSGNALTELDVSANTKLTVLKCSYNKLTELNVNHLSSLRTLYIAGNALSTLELSGTAVTDFSASTQDISVTAYESNGAFFVDMKTVVGEENIDRLTFYSGGTYDSTTGILSLYDDTVFGLYNYHTESPGDLYMEVEFTAELPATAITFTAPSREWEYDGMYHADNTYTITAGALRSGHRVSAIKYADGSEIIGVGSAVNTIESIKIVDANGSDVSSMYDISFVSGTLTVKARAVKISVEGLRVFSPEEARVTEDMFVYDGTLANGHSISVKPVYIDGDGNRLSAITQPGLYSPDIGDLTVLDRNGEDVTENYSITTEANSIILLPGGECGDVKWKLDGDTLTIYGSGAMADCYANQAPWYAYRKDISAVVVESGVTHIGNCAFYGLEKMESLNLYDGLESIGDYAFNNCKSLAGMNIPSTVETIGNSAFSGCSALSGVIFSESLTKLGASALRGTAIESISIPAGLKEIGSYAFSDCANLCVITVDEENPNYSADDCGVLFDKAKTLLIRAPQLLDGVYEIPESVVTVGESAFNGCTVLDGVTIPESVVKLSGSAFYDCASLESFELPKGLTELDYTVLSGCSGLKSLTVPAGVTVVNSYALARCTGLEEIIFTGNAPEFNSNCFQNVSATVYYPAGDDSWTENIMQTYGGSVTWKETVDTNVYINEANFPDEVFRQYISDNFDLDGKGYLTEEEALAVEELTLEYCGISDFSGIEYFPQLRQLYVTGNRLTQLDVSANTELEFLWCNDNNLDTLDVSNNTKLQVLWCGYNALSELDVSKNTQLTALVLQSNSISALDVSNNTKLEMLGCSENALTALDVSKNTELMELNCSGNSLVRLNVSGNGKLESLYCDNNSLTQLDLSGCTALTALTCGVNKLSALNVSANTALLLLDCIDNKLTELDVSSNTLLVGLSCRENKLTVLNLDSNPDISDIYADGQTSEAEAERSGASLVVDMAEIVGGENLDRIQFVTGGSYDGDTGLITLTGLEDGAETHNVSYSYITSAELGYEDMTVNLTVSIPEKKTAKIIRQPESAIVREGESVDVSLEAEGDGLTYKWYYAPAGSSSFKVSGLCIGNSYTMEMTSARDGRQVYCIITDAYGVSVKSSTATIYMGEPVKIVSQPQDVEAVSGKTAKTTVKAEGVNLKYTWYYANVGEEFAVSSATTNSYSTTMNDVRDGRRVFCVITDAAGNSLTSETATLTMAETVKIVSQPKTVIVSEGDTAVVSLAAEGKGLTYKWYYAAKGSSSFKVSGLCTGNSYTMEMTSARDGRQVYCVITDQYGVSVKSSTATIYMGEPVKIVSQPQDVEAVSGKTAKTTVKAEGVNLKYTWYFANVGEEFAVSSATTNSYSTTMNDVRDGRRVYCVITDAVGNSVTSETATLYMGGPV